MGRPIKSYFGFIGQTSIISSIDRIVSGCKVSTKPFPHSLLVAPSGYGKTHLTEVIAKSMRSKLHYLLCGKETTREDLSKSLLQLKHSDILMVDEVHGLKPSVLEMLYPCMDSMQTLSFNKDKDSKQETKWIKIKPCTILGATNLPGLLRGAYLRRCAHVYQMHEYTHAELRAIVMQRAIDAGLSITPQAVTLLAKVCRGCPRNLKHMLNSLKLYFHESIDSEIGKKQVQQFLQAENIDSLGLTTRDKVYIHTLFRAKRPLSVQVPQIICADDVRKVKEMSRFHPNGQRGVCRYVRAAGFSSRDKSEYFRSADENILILQLEGKEAIDNLDSILEEGGMDVLFIGPYDLSQSMGVPGEVTHPLVAEQMRKIVERCLQAGVAVGTFVESAEISDYWRSQGVKYISNLLFINRFQKRQKCWWYVWGYSVWPGE